MEEQWENQRISESGSGPNSKIPKWESGIRVHGEGVHHFVINDFVGAGWRKRGEGGNAEDNDGSNKVVFRTSS
jgi:hypothetical protein